MKTEKPTQPKRKLEDIVGDAINDGRQDVAIALVDAVHGRGAYKIRKDLVTRVVHDPYDGVDELLKPLPIPMTLYCPKCGGRHIDEGEFATKVHHTHACQFCGLNWRPAIVPTVGVQFLPGFKNEPTRNTG